MPRSVGIFRRIGWDVVPFPVDFKTPKETDEVTFDVGEGTEKAYLALHEWVGLVTYYLTGKSASLFPAATDRGAAATARNGTPAAARPSVETAHAVRAGAGQPGDQLKRSSP